MIRIGIVGCGRILAAHLEGYRILREAGVDGFEITALCARKAEDALGYVKRGEGPPQRRAVSAIPGDPLAVGDQYLSDFQPGTKVEVFTDYREMIASGRVEVDRIVVGLGDSRSDHPSHIDLAAQTCLQRDEHDLAGSGGFGPDASTWVNAQMRIDQRI